MGEVCAEIDGLLKFPVISRGWTLVRSDHPIIVELFIHDVIVIITAYHEDMGIKIIIIGVRKTLGNFNFC